MLLDDASGDAYMMRAGQQGARFLHKHAQRGSGAAWCDERACTTSWDGKILCSSADGETTDMIAHYSAPIRALASTGGRCFAAVADGGIYDLRSPQVPVYRHRHEPYRAAVSLDGARIASGDGEGTVKVWDVAGQHLIAELTRLHRGRVSGIAWLGERLVTAGGDGTVRLLAPTLQMVQSWNVGAPVQDIRASSEAIHATLFDGTLWSVSLTTGAVHRISMDATFTSLAVSPQGTVAAGTEHGDLIIVDTERRIATRYFEHGGVTCAAFEHEHSLLACVQDGRIVRLDITAQTFASRRNASP
jgi:WD40 repeat protein